MEHPQLLNSTAIHPSPRSGTIEWPPKLRRVEAARYLREHHGIPVSPATLAKWFCLRSDGPPAYLAGRVPLYPRDALDSWAHKRLGPLRTSTSDNLAA
jgi:hypothetical protein